jgi:hypothetical protein
MAAMRFTFELGASPRSPGERALRRLEGSFRPGAQTAFETLVAAPGSATYLNVAVDAYGPSLRQTGNSSCGNEDRHPAEDRPRSLFIERRMPPAWWMSTMPHERS